MLHSRPVRAPVCALALLTLLASPVLAQRQAAPTTTRHLTLGYTTLGDWEGDGVAIAAEWPVATFGARWGIGVGGMVGMHHNAEPFGPVRLTTRILPVLGVGNLTYQRHPQSRVALYGGLTAGVNIVRVRGFTPTLGIPDERGANLAIGGQLGARVRLAQRVGVMAQVGVGDIPGVFTGLSWRW